MEQESNLRTTLKGITYRLIATLTTFTIVYFFFGRLDYAIIAGALETSLKIVIYFFHEKLWQKIKWGKNKIQPINLMFTGLPCSGKSTIANGIYEKVKNIQVFEFLDSKETRRIIPSSGFKKIERISYLQSISVLVKKLQDNSASTICSFIFPYAESREHMKENTSNCIEIYIKCSLEECINRDKKGMYLKASSGEIKNFTGVSQDYEVPKNPNLIINSEENSLEECIEIINKYLIDNKYLQRV